MAHQIESNTRNNYFSVTTTKQLQKCIALPLLIIVLISSCLAVINCSQQQQQPMIVSHKSPLNSRQFGDTINDIHIECNSDNIVVTLSTNQGFNGMIYPKGLSKNSSCMMEYHQLSSNITYYLPLKSCNTMSTDVEDGVEYFNTVMVQPHRRLVTNQGRGYHIRCRYQTKERTITNQEQQLSVNLTHSTPAVLGSASMPTCSMRIFSGQDLRNEVAAENVKIGDELHLVIALEDQDVYGMLVTNCLVRDGMNWGEQQLIDDFGCPVDEEIMPEFSYASNLTRASVSFQAHKFPYTSSVYYQCNVRLCFRDSNGCSHVPPNCSQLAARSRTLATSTSSPSTLSLGNDIDLSGQQQQQQQQQHRRHRRWLDAGDIEALALPSVHPEGDGRPAVAAAKTGAGQQPMSFQVSSGLSVDETSELKTGGDSGAAAAAAASLAEADPLMLASTNDDPQETRLTAAIAAAQTASENNEENNTSNNNNNNSNSNTNAKQSERDFCLSLRKFAIIISLISLLLMALIIMMVACAIKRRNDLKLREAQQQQQQYQRSHY